jgi:GNAT superfamily N-acetyltransferase
MIHDHELAARIESAYARDGEAAAEADRKLRPEAGATSESLAGGSMIFCGVDSFMTHALGVGVSAPVAEEDLDRMEDFFFGRGAVAEIDLCPFADPSLPGRLFHRGYRPDHFEQALIRELAIEDASERIGRFEGVRVVLATPELEDAYCALLSRAFDLPEEYGGALEHAGRVAFASEDVRIYAGLADDRLVAAGAMRISGDVVSLFGAATLPAFRGRGLQAALLAARLRDASQEGCSLASVNSLVGSTSERNLERAGFHPAYTRTVLRKARPQESPGS